MPTTNPTDDTSDIAAGHNPVTWLNENWFFELGDILNLDMRRHGGFCYGIACMTMQAILMNELWVLKKRFNLINGLTDDEINSLIKKQQQSGHHEPYTQKEIDILAFYNGVMIYQNTQRKQSHLFEKYDWGEVGTAASILAPVTLHDHYLKWKANQPPNDIIPAGSAIATPFLATGIFDQNTMFNWLTSLVEQLKTNNVTYPIVICLNNVEHTIQISYDPIERKWICSNNFTIFESGDTAEVANFLFNIKEFLPDNTPESQSTIDKLVLTTHFLVATPNLKNANDVLTNWSTCPDAQTVYHYTHKKMMAEDEKHLNELVRLSISSGNACSLKELLDNGVFDITTSFTEAYGDPFIVAARTSCNPSILMELLSSGLRINSLVNSTDPADKRALRMLESHVLNNFLGGLREINLNDLITENDNYNKIQSTLFSLIRAITATSQKHAITTQAHQILNLMNEMLITKQTPLDTPQLSQQLDQLAQLATLSLLPSKGLLVQLSYEFVNVSKKLDPASAEDKSLSASLEKLLSAIQNIEARDPSLAYRIADSIANELIQITYDIANLKPNDMESKVKLTGLIEQGMSLFEKKTPRDPRARPPGQTPVKRTPNST